MEHLPKLKTLWASATAGPIRLPLAERGILAGNGCCIFAIAGNDNGPSIAWLNLGETAEQATARWRTNHPGKDPETELMFITWSNTSVGGEIG
jgi:hypothetical protein